MGLLPKGLFTGLLEERQRGASCYDLLGGLFATVEPVELTPGELGLLLEAAKEDWSRVQPIIFCTLFEDSLDKEQRHALGAHFIYEADIQKIVRPDGSTAQSTADAARLFMTKEEAPQYPANGGESQRPQRSSKRKRGTLSSAPCGSMPGRISAPGSLQREGENLISAD